MNKISQYLPCKIVQMAVDHLVDGPYILGNTVRYVTESGNVKDFPLDRTTKLKVCVPNEDSDHFNLQLKSELKPFSEEFEMPNRLLAITDIEGNFNGLASFLSHNGVIDHNFDWIFADGHFLINGDLVDRGPYPMGILWLMYKLESQAEEAGGKVHINLGNHDLMNIQGWCDYAHADYQRVVKAVTERLDAGQAFRFLHSKISEIGKWLRTKNTVIKIGDLLFVHGGLSYELLPYRLSLKEINDIVRKHLDEDFYFNASQDQVANHVMGRRGPIWYRTLARAHEGQPMDSQQQLESVLNFYKVAKMIIGHTVVQDICTDYQEKLIKIDVLHGQAKNSGITKGILVEDGIVFKIDDLGRREVLS